MFQLNPKRKKEVLTLVAVFLLVLVASAAAVYLIAGRTSAPTTPTPRTSERPAQPTGTPPASAQPTASVEDGFLAEVFTPQDNAEASGETWPIVFGKLTMRLLLAALLGAALAFRPRRKVLAIKRNPSVAQTQILLAVVAAALMIVVGDNAARAFGIFAAVSLVRFRTNIRDPKEITVLLVSLALGLATGVGRWDLAMVLTLFSLALLWILEYREPDQVFRSMELKITTTDVGATHAALRGVIDKHGFDSELRALGRENQENSGGVINYALDIAPSISTDVLSEELLAKDAEHIVSIEWDQKKSYSYLYQ